MGFFDRFRKNENRGETVEFEDALLSALLGSGKADKKMALQIPAVAGGIDLIANIVSGTPIKLYRDEGGKAVEISDDYRVTLLNDETGDTLNANEFWHAMIRDYYLGKGGYAYINKARGKVKSLHFVDEEKVSILKNTNPIFKDYSIHVSGMEYRPFDFLKILRNTKDGAQGTPITEENSRLIEVAYQKMVLEYSMAKRGGNKKGYLKAEKRLDTESMNTLKANWAALYANDADNAIVLNKDIDFHELSDTAAEMQLDENKRTNAVEFAKLFHVSAEAMAGSDGNVGVLAKLAAIPLMQVIQCALNRDLLLEREKGSYYFAYDTKELLKGDMRERAEFYAKMIDANVMQIDEVRYMEDLPSLGLDFIKLGLQDVLYDPKTKQIYTPNTNQTGGLSDSPLQDVPEDDTINKPEPETDPEKEQRSNDYIQDPSTGKMNGSHPSRDKDSGGSGDVEDRKEGHKNSAERRKQKLEKWEKESEGYEEARKEIQRRIDDGEYSLELPHQKYLQHVDGTSQFKNVEKTREKKQSYLTISEEKAQKLIHTYSAKGDPQMSKKGSPTNIEFANSSDVVGCYFENGKYNNSTRFAIVHGKDGSHIYPVKPKEE